MVTIGSSSLAGEITVTSSILNSICCRVDFCVLMFSAEIQPQDVKKWFVYELHSLSIICKTCIPNSFLTQKFVSARRFLDLTDDLF